jgi:hypothetical protein
VTGSCQVCSPRSSPPCACSRRVDRGVPVRSEPCGEACGLWSRARRQRGPGGADLGSFPATADHVFWWVSDYDWRSNEETDFRLRSIGRDGRREVLRAIKGLVRFNADEPRVAWMDRAEGSCDSDVIPHKGVVWVAPLQGEAPRRILGSQMCAMSILLKGDDVFWTTESDALWWASVRTGQHLLVSGACDRAWISDLSDRWVYVSRADKQVAGRGETVRVPWWR